MLQLGTSADMFMMALVAFVSTGWPALFTGAVIGWRFSMLIESLVVTLVGAVITSVWVHVSGFATLLGSEATVIIGTVCFFGGGLLGTVAQIIKRTVRRRTA